MHMGWRVASNRYSAMAINTTCMQMKSGLWKYATPDLICHPLASSVYSEISVNLTHSFSTRVQSFGAAAVWSLSADRQFHSAMFTADVIRVVPSPDIQPAWRVERISSLCLSLTVTRTPMHILS
jgi:hypothetical protein